MRQDALVLFLKKRTKRRFARVVDAYRDDILNAAFRVLRSQDLAEDVTQETFVKLLTAKWTPERIRSGRGVLVSNAILNALLRLRSEERRTLRERTAATRRSRQSGALSLNELMDVRDAILELPEALRACVDLRYYGGLSIHEVAATLGCSRTAVNDRLHKAREILKQKLGPASGVLLLPLFLDAAESAETLVAASRGLEAKLEGLSRNGVAMAAIASGARTAPIARLLVAALLIVAVGGGLLVYLSTASRSDPPRTDVSLAVRSLPSVQTDRRETSPRPVFRTAKPIAEMRQENAAPATAPLAIRGYVVDENELPVPDAWVGLFEAETAFAKEEYSFVGLQPNGLPTARGVSDEATVPGLVSLDEAHTDGRGYFEFDVSYSDAYYLRAEGPDHAAVGRAGPLVPSVEPLSLAVFPVATLHGSVTDAASGVAVHGARVLLKVKHGLQARAQTDIDGVFRLYQLPSGAHELEVVHHAYDQAHRVTVSVATGLGQVALAMKNADGGILVSGTVTDATTHQPIAGARIATTFEDYKAITDPTGVYRFRLSKEMRTELNIRASGYGVETTEVGGSPGPFVRNVSLRPSRTLTCQVVGPGRGVVGNAKVRMRIGADTFYYYGRTDTTGTSVFDDVPEGTRVDLFAFHETEGQFIAREVELPAEEEPFVIELVKPEKVLAVTVLDAEETPVPGAQVLLMNQLSENPERLVRFYEKERCLSRSPNFLLRLARANDSGVVVIPDLFQESCLVQAFGPDYNRETMGISFYRQNYDRSDIELVELSPDTCTTECALVLWRPFTARGQVATNGGSIVKGVPVRLLVEKSGEWNVLYTCETNRHGNFRFTGLDPNKRSAVAIEKNTPHDWTLVADPRELVPDGEEERFLLGWSFGGNDTLDVHDLYYFREIVPAWGGEDWRTEIVLKPAGSPTTP